MLALKTASSSTSLVFSVTSSSVGTLLRQDSHSWELCIPVGLTGWEVKTLVCHGVLFTSPNPNMHSHTHTHTDTDTDTHNQSLIGDFPHRGFKDNRWTWSGLALQWDREEWREYVYTACMRSVHTHSKLSSGHAWSGSPISTVWGRQAVKD